MKPEAIVVFTAHWEQEVTTVTTTDGIHDLIYDFGGFPDELYRIRYPARGSRSLAERILGLLGESGLPVRSDDSRGLDHGTWTLLYRMFPKADIPVVQLSVNPHLPPLEQVRIGEALSGLRKDNILIIGSGVTVHNLRLVRWGHKEAEPWAVEFDDWLVEKLEQRDREALLDYANRAPHARQGVPREEHFVPFFIAMGAGGEDGAAKVIHRGYQFGSLSYLCLQFE